MLASIRILVLLLAFLACAPAARAQQHETRENTRCRFARFPYTNSEGGVVCYACVADRDKEHKAKVAADKQRAAAQDAANTAKRNAEQVAFKKKQQQEDQQKTARRRSGEVLINGSELYRPAPSTTAKKTKALYKVVDGFSLDNPPDVTKASLSKVFCDGKLAFSSTRFSYITLNYYNNFTPYFIGTLPRTAGCPNSYLNNEVLLDKTGKQIKFGAIEEFGFISSSLQDPEHIEVVMYKNTCENIEGNRYDKSRWPTIRHLYSLITMQEVEATDSAQLGDCNCP